MPIKQLPILFILFFCVLVNGQEHPPIQIFTPNEYGGENQNWSISQSKEKHIYVANNKGLLVFNGAKWVLYNSPNQTIVRSVNVIDELIYTGCYREFGFWKKNSLGILNYTSLSSKLKISFLEDEEIWNIIHVDDFILFQSLKRIYVYNQRDDTCSIISSNTVLYKVFKINEGVYFQKTKEGVFEIVNGKARLVSNHPILKENLLVNIFNHQGNLLFQTEDNGFYIFKDNTLIKWDISANEVLLNDRIYSSIKLKDQSFILGTISNGILHVTSDGDIEHYINQNNGLSNNTVLSVFEDVDNNVWLGLENGINCINLSSPFTIYNGEKGKIGSVNTSILFNNYLYIGTNQGLFYKEINSDNQFKLVPGTQGAVWCLTNIDNTLFCGNNSGTFIINGAQAQFISDIQGTWNIKTISKNNKLLLQGNYNGLNILENKHGQWVFKNKIEGFDISSRYFEILNGTDVFVSHEYKGVFKVKLDANYTKAISVLKDTSVAQGLKTSLIKYHNQLLYTQKEGVFKYDEIKNRFVRDSILSGLFLKEQFTSGKLVFIKETNTLWSFSLHDISYFAPFKLSNSYKINKIPLPSSLRNDVSGYENISYINNNKYLYGNTLGYIIIDLDKLNEKPHKVNIDLISKGYYKKNSFKTEFLDPSTKGIFKNNENNLEFNFSVPEYDKYLEAEYQYKLEGIYNFWSKWSTQSNALFENLPFGEYTFYVKSRIGNDVSENIESYSFKIDPPWYLTKVMFGVYFILVALFSLFMHTVYKRYYRKQREKLLYKTQRDLELKELENKQQLMRFNNENLRQDIDNKNRELAISTMSLIKKNEFLNNIKSELQKAQDQKSLKSVIKIIDKNLNNTDDWHAFEEAFNNADQDFLKKIKSEHPSLTSNDLRLCAYLRLNLSSKEIAPLLNISSRSVEVKRYRLRKKMDLPHESSLTDYILEI
ncbi:triple tyrosine motif-containing protein [Mariniflexile gromovii]|uniref:LuxR family transcriptional regulator n=1 Tax=Mariniflexile gromovii TaxID=362523 RepID=A0ABS4BQP0_9FLAO|nr:triple tyrosine motif-containing protein [Mariniflexile gromovii]MBP0902898.1 LuxR family transcriptional regulator [Mariniflexile gromovii]